MWPGMHDVSSLVWYPMEDLTADPQYVANLISSNHPALPLDPAICGAVKCCKGLIRKLVTQLQ